MMARLRVKPTNGKVPKKGRQHPRHAETLERDWFPLRNDAVLKLMPLVGHEAFAIILAVWYETIAVGKSSAAISKRKLATTCGSAGASVLRQLKRLDAEGFLVVVKQQGRTGRSKTSTLKIGPRTFEAIGLMGDQWSPVDHGVVAGGPLV